jgi:hypothetical protein
MKEWPSDPAKPIDFGAAIDPLKRALYHLYFLAPRHRSVDYDGHNLGKSELATTPTPKWALSEEGIAQSRSDGRSPVETILQTAFQLGIEQGRRLHRKKLAPAVHLVDAMLATCVDSTERSTLEYIKGALTDWSDQC